MTNIHFQNNVYLKCTYILFSVENNSKSLWTLHWLSIDRKQCHWVQQRVKATGGYNGCVPVQFLYLNLYLPTRSTNDWVLYTFSPLKTPQNIKLNVIQQIQVQLWIIYNMPIQLQKNASFVQTNRSTVVEFDINFNNRIYKFWWYSLLYKNVGLPE